MTHPLARAAATLAERHVRYVLIGVYGANLYAPAAQAVFATEDADLFLPPDPDNVLRAWQAGEAADFEIMAGLEPLDQPRDRQLAERVVAGAVLTRAAGREIDLDFTLTMSGYAFDPVWQERRLFVVDGVELPVARLQHIVRSKQLAGRPKDTLFLATHYDALQQLLKRDEP